MKKSVLIVEDDLVIRDTLRDLLEDEGYNVFDAANGLDALRKLPGLPPLSLAVSSADEPRRRAVPRASPVGMLPPAQPLGRGQRGAAPQAGLPGARLQLGRVRLHPRAARSSLGAAARGGPRPPARAVRRDAAAGQRRLPGRLCR